MHFDFDSQEVANFCFTLDKQVDCNLESFAITVT